MTVSLIGKIIYLLVKLNGHEFEQVPGNGEGQRSLACCSSWRRKESDTTDQLNTTTTRTSLVVRRLGICLPI